MIRKCERTLILAQMPSVGWLRQGDGWRMHVALVDPKEPDRPTYLEGPAAELIGMAEAVLQAVQALRLAHPEATAGLSTEVVE